MTASWGSFALGIPHAHSAVLIGPKTNLVLLVFLRGGLDQGKGEEPQTNQVTEDMTGSGRFSKCPLWCRGAVK